MKAIAVIDMWIARLEGDSVEHDLCGLRAARESIVAMIDIQRRLVAWDRNVNGGGSELGQICDEAAASIAHLDGSA